ncbi:MULTISPECIES: peptidase domain-containing ABC transporter [Luteibacter]|uniref:peptidase domain-containing ABC transporter n=1 Tax=Luteibacter TaxID=242605 RepID=UPI00056B5484|nr:MULTISPECIES: peptidase domain-containing ABC transporter [unclassified Luteibacter]
MRANWEQSLQMGFGRTLGMIYQSEVADCGLACLAMVASYYGSRRTLSTMRNSFGSSSRGVTLARLADNARSIGMQSRALHASPSQLSQLRLPAILHWEGDHFVVLKAITRTYATIHDPAIGVRRIKLSRLSGLFSNVALELFPGDDFSRGEKSNELTLSSLLSNVRGMTATFLQVGLVALVLEALGISIPFYMQWVTDHVIVNQDSHLMTVLGLGFLAVVIFQSAFNGCRSWLIMWAGANLNVQWSSNFFSRLLKLPYDWYEKRHMGDIVSRLGASQTIQKTLTSQFVGTVIDGIMSMATLILMGIYNVRLLLVSVAVLSVYVILRAIFFWPLRRANEEQINSSAHLQSEILEAIRNVATIKLASQQGSRSSRYIETVTDLANSDLSAQKITSLFTILSQCVQGLGRVVLVWLATIQVLDGAITVGMMIAFAAYSDQFISRGAGLADKVVEIRMLGLHLSRLSDIVSSPVEPGYEEQWDGPDLLPRLSVRNLYFRYDEASPWVIENVSFDINPGESVAIVGRSGCGKTTLVKLLTGLIQPTSGEVLYGGVPILKLGMSRYRHCMAAVMQEDSLMSGALEDNITFGDPAPERDRIYRAASAALIHDDILAMPMGYRTVVGNLGAALSGGQKQRLMLARALYREPRLLLLDEATSHLDAYSESLVSEAIRSLSITRVMIAHRQETIRTADRIIQLDTESDVDGRNEEAVTAHV